MIKKKGRKPKSYYQNLDNSNNLIINDSSINSINSTNNTNNTNSTNSTNSTNNSEEIKVPKKRGRKPKGGIVVEEKKNLDNSIPIPNIILHLKCKLIELNDINHIMYNPNIEKINNYNIQEKNLLNFNFIKENETFETFETFENNDFESNISDYKNSKKNNNDNTDNNEIFEINSKQDICNDRKKSNFEFEKTISKKLKELSYNLKHNNIESKSDCFWCTYSFDNECIVIPKYELDSKIYCYGSFCSPECACSYLMNDSTIDTSTKFERYYLLNNIYGKIYDYNKNIKPAPNPHYLLKKFNGNLDIQEYRQLLQNERFLLVVDKPLTKIFPELYEENDDFFVNCKTVTKNNLKLKRNN